MADVALLEAYFSGLSPLPVCWVCLFLPHYLVFASECLRRPLLGNLAASFLVTNYERRSGSWRKIRIIFYCFSIQPKVLPLLLALMIAMPGNISRSLSPVFLPIFPNSYFLFHLAFVAIDAVIATKLSIKIETHGYE